MHTHFKRCVNREKRSYGSYQKKWKKVKKKRKRRGKKWKAHKIFYCIVVKITNAKKIFTVSSLYIRRKKWGKKRRQKWKIVAQKVDRGWKTNNTKLQGCSYKWILLIRRVRSVKKINFKRRFRFSFRMLSSQFAPVVKIFFLSLP